MPRRTTPEQLQEVLRAIPVADRGGVPISASDLAWHLGLKIRQVYHRIGILRDVGVEYVHHTGHREPLPLLSDRHGYLFSTDSAHNFSHRRWRGKFALTILRRTLNGAVRPFIASLPVHQQADARRIIERSFSRAIEDLADMITTGHPT